MTSRPEVLASIAVTHRPYSMTPRPICKEDGCARNSRSRGYCNMHYMKRKRAGEFSTETKTSEPKPGGRPAICVHPDCRKPVKALDVCGQHYEQGRLQKVQRTAGMCTMNECPRVIYARGLCKSHYNMAQRKTGFSRPPAEVRFWSKVDKNGPIVNDHPDLGRCWLWTDTINRGYGQFHTDGSSKRAHRVAWEMQVGPIPEGVILDHMCHNRACVNPAHLRESDVKRNAENRSGPQSNNRSSRFRGVSQRDGRWYARVGHNGEIYCLGVYDTEDEAAEVARRARVALHTASMKDRARPRSIA